MTAHRMISERDRVIVDQAGQIRDLKLRVADLERQLAQALDLLTPEQREEWRHKP